MSASCIGDLAEKFPAQVAPYLIPQLLSLLAQQSAPARYGGCIGLSQALCHMSRTVLSPFRDGAMQATQKLLWYALVLKAIVLLLINTLKCFEQSVW